MRKVFSVGSLLAISLNILIYLYFDKLFGETPVNLLGLGGRNGHANLIFNLFSFAVITLVITTIISLAIVHRREWILTTIIGVSLSSFGLYIYIMAYLALVWSKTGI